MSCKPPFRRDEAIGKDKCKFAPDCYHSYRPISDKGREISIRQIKEKIEATKACTFSHLLLKGLLQEQQKNKVIPKENQKFLHSEYLFANKICTYICSSSVILLNYKLAANFCNRKLFEQYVTECLPVSFKSFTCRFIPHKLTF